VFIDEYAGGGGVKTFGELDGRPVYAEGELPDAEVPSAYVFLEPYNAPEYDDIISVTGFLGDAFGRYTSSVVNATKPCYVNYAYANALYGFQERMNMERTTEGQTAETGSFFPCHSQLISYRGATGYWNHSERDFSMVKDSAGGIPTKWYDAFPTAFAKLTSLLGTARVSALSSTANSTRLPTLPTLPTAPNHNPSLFLLSRSPSTTFVRAAPPCVFLS
jgi:hypothetical protein